MNRENVPRYVFSIFMAISCAAYMIIGPQSIGEPLIKGMKDVETSGIKIALVSATSFIISFGVWKEYFSEKKSKRICKYS